MIRQFIVAGLAAALTSYCSLQVFHTMTEPTWVCETETEGRAAGAQYCWTE